MSDKTPGQLPVRRVRVVRTPGSGDTPPRQSYARQRPPRPDKLGLMPYFIGGGVSVALSLLIIVVWLLMSSPGGGKVIIPPSPAANGNINPADLPTQVRVAGTAMPGEIPTGDPAAIPAVPTGSPPPVGDPPRINLLDFKKLYDDTAKRPVILDVRTQEAYDEGHIMGATLFPEADVDARAKELPKDRLIVAYCACGAEETSVRVAKKLKDSYGFTYDQVNVLLGGWDLWNTKSKQDPKGYPTSQF